MAKKTRGKLGYPASKKRTGDELNTILVVTAIHAGLVRHVGHYEYPTFEDARKAHDVWAHDLVLHGDAFDATPPLPPTIDPTMVISSRLLLSDGVELTTHAIIRSDDDGESVWFNN